MRFTVRSLALVSAGALVAIGLTVPSASAAASLSVSSVSPAIYGPDSTTQTVGGTAMFPSHTVYVILTNPSNTSSGMFTTTSDANGNWSFVFQAAAVAKVNDGTVTVTAGEYYCPGVLSNTPANGTKCPDIFGQPTIDASSQSATKTFIKDVHVPDAPAIGEVGTSNVITGSNQHGVSVKGTGEKGDTVNLSLLDSSNATVVTATATVDNSNNWVASIDASSIPDGAVTVRATQTETGPLHNVSTATTKSVTKDTTGPRLFNAAPADGTTVARPSQVAFAYHEALGSGTVTVTSGGNAVTGTTTNANGTATWKPSAALATGSYSATATVTDSNGNQTVSTISFTVDATAPVITNLKSTNTSAGTANTTVSGSVDEKSTLTITSTDSKGAKATKTLSNVAAGTFSTSYAESSLAAGTITVSVKAVDPYGNTSTTTTTHTRTAPAVTTVSLSVPTWTGVGWNLTLKGTVHQLKPAAYGSVTIVHTTLSGKQQIVATVGVDSKGNYSYTFKPNTSGKYYAIYNGDSKNSGAQSPTYFSQLRYAISASSASGPATSKALITGAVHYPPAGAYVLVYKKNADGSWTQIGKAYIDKSYHYSLSVLLPKGSTTIKVEIPASHGFYGNGATFTATRT